MIAENAWCRDERLNLGMDVLIARRHGYTLVQCVGEFGPHNIHAGKWIVWGRDGHCAAIGSEAWARERFNFYAPVLSMEKPADELESLLAVSTVPWAGKDQECKKS